MKKTPHLIAEIEALHDAITGNHILYTEEALAQIDTWIHPYQKPVIFHHKDEDGKIVGRIIEAKKIKSQIDSKLNALWFKTRITDEATKEGIRDGTYLTTSIGASGTDVECSICGHKISSGIACNHKRGKYYKGKLCYWIVKKMVGKEISLVIVPSDQYSRIVRFYDENTLHSKGDEQMDLQEALEKIKELEAKIVSQKETLSTQAETIQESQLLQEKLTETESLLEQETFLREGLEAELTQLRLIEKETLVNDIISLRESLQMRALDAEVLNTKSEIYLKESLEDLKAELSFKESLKEEEQEEDMTKLQEKLNNEEIILEKTTPVKTTSTKDIMNNLL